MLSEKKIAAILALQAPKRYGHFIKTVVDGEKAWGLYSDGWALSATDDGMTVFPIWPAMEYAELCAFNEWRDYKAREISLGDLLTELIPKLEQDGLLLGIFPTPEDKGMTPELEIITEDLRNEMIRYE